MESLHINPTSETVNAAWYWSVEPYTIESVTLVDGQMIVIKQYQSNITYTQTLTIATTGTYHDPGRRVKEVYGVKDGKIVHLKSIDGVYTPPSAEHWDFPEDE